MQLDLQDVCTLLHAEIEATQKVVEASETMNQQLFPMLKCAFCAADVLFGISSSKVRTWMCAYERERERGCVVCLCVCVCM